MTRFMWCSTSRMVRSKSSRIRRTNAASCSTSSCERPPAGSSSSRRRGPEASAPAVSTRLSVAYGSEPRALGDVADPDVVDDLVDRAPPVACVRADDDVLAHGHRLEELEVLEGARDAAATTRCGGVESSVSPSKFSSPASGGRGA
jgi:hypothetical protein